MLVQLDPLDPKGALDQLELRVLKVKEDREVTVEILDHRVQPETLATEVKLVRLDQLDHKEQRDPRGRLAKLDNLEKGETEAKLDHLELLALMDSVELRVKLELLDFRDNEEKLVQQDPMEKPETLETQEPLVISDYFWNILLSNCCLIGVLRQYFFSFHDMCKCNLYGNNIELVEI